MMTIPVTWLLLFIVSCVSSDSHDENTRQQVATPSGTFKGIIQQSLQSHSYAAFLGIPYALPPVGNLRFAKPEPYPHIDTVFDASTAAPSCVQSSRLNVSSYGQEDCLYLNVYVPLEENESIGNGDTFKKVFVFIHGGDWLTGSSNQYVPGDMVALGDIIVVTFNYRLSWLGFLKGPTPELSGNQGIWDQLLALNWVRNNIRSFGGDPYDVTAGGHAMGAKSVSLLSIVPQAKTLFTKGIISSSSMFKDASTVGSSDDLLEILAKKVGCKESDHTKTIECMRNLPVESFLTPPDLSVAQKFITIDGDLLTLPLSDLIQNNTYLTKVGFFSRNYLVTLTNNEGSIYFHGNLPCGIEPEQLDPEFLSRWTNISLEYCIQILNWYRQPLHSNFRPHFDILGDFEIFLPTIDFLKIFDSGKKDSSKAGNSKSYLLLFDHQPLYLPSHLFGTIHGLDLNYLFDFNPSGALRIFYNLEADDNFIGSDWMTKKRYTDIVTDFVRTGDPGRTLSEDLLFKWQAYNVKTKSYLRFDSYPTQQNYPLKDRLKLWDNLTPNDGEKVINYKLRDEL